MSYYDLLNNRPSSNILKEEYDYCIIGSGPAGLSLVSDLVLDSDLKILLIESGSHEEDSKTQKLYEANSFSLRNSKFEMKLNDKNYPLSSRLRYLGGSSNHWDGWTRALDGIDLNHINQELKWPIQLKDLEKYYLKARKTLEVENELPDEEMGKKIRKIPYRISPPVKFGKKFNGLMNSYENLVVLLNANLCDVSVDQNKNVKTLKVKNLLDESYELKSKCFVLCCGGIENARLLLNFAEDKGEFKSNVLGKRFNDHLFFPMNNSLFIYGDEKAGFNQYVKNHLNDQHMPALALKEDEVSKFKLNNSSIIILNKSEKQNIRPAVENAGIVYDTVFVTEATPLMSSQIRLSEKRDQLGLKKIDMSWQVLDHDLEAPLAYLKKLDLELNKESVGKLRTIFDYRPDERIYWEGYHHMGTTTMGESQETSYVDKNLKIHGLNNFYVAGSSVFPSPGFANPTLTIVALSHRLAEHLMHKKERV